MFHPLSALLSVNLPAWGVAAFGGVMLAQAVVARVRVRRLAERVKVAQEKLADDLWEIKAAGDARLRAEAATQKKTRFLATVSHEVRTPLNGILGMAELLGTTPLDPEQQAYLDAIQTSGRALNALIGEVLDVSRIEAGKLELAAEPFDVQALVESVVELLGPRAQEKGLEVAARIAPEVVPMRVGDPARLRQIVLNLAGNAIKFTEQGGVGVLVAVDPLGRLQVTVSDTGPGVPPDRRAAIFDEFEQGSIESARQHGGAGLGLAISRRLVELMGGALTLADRPGGGSVFGFSIDLPVAERARLEVPTLPDLRGATVLIVAQSPFQAPYLAHTLGQAGARVTLAPSAEQGVAILDGGVPAPDFLLVDCALGKAATHSLADAAARAGVARALLLFSPMERRAFGQKLATAFGGWLVKPVRAASLAKQIHGTTDKVLATPVTVIKPLPGHSDLRVLLAEDNEINTMIMLKMLDRIGAQVIHAPDGSVALKAALAAMRGETAAFDTILLDLSMPGLSGQEAARLLRRAEQDRGAAPTRIVALTANAFEDDRQACFEAGIDEFLTKPIDLARLRETLLAAGSETPVAAVAGR